MGFLILVALGLLGAEPAVDLAVGEPAPYSGTLISSEMALACVTCVRVDLPTCQAGAKHAEAVTAAKIERLEAERDAERLRGVALAAALATRIEPAPARRWYEHPALWAGIGFAVGVVVGVPIGGEL